MSENSGFKLKSFENIFAATDPDSKSKSEPIYNLYLDKLFPYKNHPFKLYQGQRFNDMVESIKANGVIIPIIVRPIDEFTYEILSGHNRVEASKAARLETIASIIKEELTDDEALLVVTETNLIQRSFADLSHSERALTLSMHHEAIRNQGKRTDLIFEIENMLNASNINENETSCPMGTKFDSKKDIGDKYDLSGRTVARYLRINKLLTVYKDMLDNGEIALRAAVTLSYLNEQEQQIVDDVLNDGNYKLDMKKAESLRQLSDNNKLTHETVEDIFSGKEIRKKPPRPTAIKIKPKVVSKFFTPEQKPSEIEETIVKALEFYFTHNQGLPDERPENQMIKEVDNDYIGNKSE